MPVGYESYLAIAEEGTKAAAGNVWGEESVDWLTALAFESESLAPAPDIFFSPELRGRGQEGDRAFRKSRKRLDKCEGAITITCYPEGGGDKGGLGLLLKHLTAGVISGTLIGTADGLSENYFLHQFIPKDRYENLQAGSTYKVYGLTVHVGREDDSGTLRNYPYVGCRIRNATFSCAAGEELKCSVEFVGRKAKDAGTAKVLSYTDLDPWMFDEAEVTIDGNSRDIDSFEVTVTNGMAESGVLGTNVLGRVRFSGMRAVTGNITAPFEGWVKTLYDKWRNHQTASLNIKFTKGTYFIFEIDLPKIVFTGAPPSVGGPEELIVTLPFQALWDDSNNYDVKFKLGNRDEVVGYDIT